MYKALNFQSKHIQNQLYKKPKMTTALAIKCNDGIILASDSQGTYQNTIKLCIYKVFEINKNIGLVGAGNDEHTRYFVDNYKKISKNYETEIELTTFLRDYIDSLHKEINKPVTSIHDKVSNSPSSFKPELLIGTKLKDDEFYIHHIQFVDEIGLPNLKPIVEIKHEFEVIGSGSYWAIPAIGTISKDLASINKNLSDLPIEINVGIAMHAISQAKESDLGSGGDTQIRIIDNNGFSKINVNNQSDRYYKAIKCLSELLGKDESSIKESLPVSITTLL
jgi:20S proteasome alpha/beta subunit